MAKPKYRFPEFTEDWEEHTLGDFATEVKRVNKDSDAPIRMISSGNGFILQSDRYSRENAGQSLKKYIELHRGEFAYNHGYSKAKIYGSCYMLTESDAARIPYVYHCFSINNGNKEFFAHLLNRTQLNKELVRYISSTARMDGLLNISYEDYMKIKLYVPSIKEQEKIAALMDDIEYRIKKQEEIISNLESQKNGLMQQLFTQEVRFTDKDGKPFSEWDETTLGELCQIRTGKLDANAMVEGGAYRFYTCAAEYYQIDTYAFDTEALLISGNGANVGYVHYYKGKFNAYQRTYVLDGFTQNIQYIKCFLEGNLKARIDSEKRAGNTPYIVFGTLADMPIFIPSLEEQERIAECINTFTAKLDAENKILEDYKLLKKGLLQQIFA